MTGTESTDASRDGEPPKAKKSRSGRNYARLEAFERVWLLLLWAVVIAVFGFLRPHTFLTVNTFSGMFGLNATLAVLALGLILILRVGDFDLSLAANLVVSSEVLGILNAEHHVSLLLSMVVAVLVGGAIGAVNAFIILKLKIDSFIATLGMGSVLSGIALWITSGGALTGLSQTLVDDVVIRRLFGISYEFYYSLVLMALLWYVFRYTAIGRRLLFVGKNREVARLSGVRVSRIRFGAFVVAGMIGALAGIIYSGTSGTTNPEAGLVYLLPAYAAAFLGATCIDIGDFNPVGTVVAVFFLVTGVQGLAILGVGNFVQDIFYGGALILSVAGSQYLARSKANRVLVAD